MNMQLNKTTTSRKTKKPKELTQFQKYFVAEINPQILNFMKSHPEGSLNINLVEILYVNIFNNFIKHKFITAQKFHAYTTPQKIDKIRYLKRKVEKKGILAKIFGFKGEETIETIEEKYIDEDPSLFKKDVKDLIMFEYFVKQQKASFDIKEIFVYEASLILKKLGYKDLSMQVINLIEHKKLYDIQHKRQDYQVQKDENKNNFTEVPGR
jgi:hypothetical protein